MIKKISDTNQFSGFSKTASALFLENGIDPNNFRKLFPDVGYQKISYKEAIPSFSTLKYTDDFVRFVNENKEKNFCIVCDYDADGIMSCIIMKLTFEKLGLNCSFVVPNRLEDGYGMTNEVIDRAIEKHAEVLITVDNGISCKDAVAYALSKNLKVFITDHHMGTDGLIPENVSIIDPIVNNDLFPEICGAFVAFKLAYALLLDNGINDSYFINEIATYAAIATVTDVMPCLSENRLLLRAAFDYIDFLKEHSVWNRVRKLINGLGGSRYLKSEDELASTDLFGFTIGPALNAISRVQGDPTELIENILSCGERGNFIDNSYFLINIERKRFTQTLLEKCEDADDPVRIILFDEKDYEFPVSGLLGLVANKVSSRENKPALVGTLSDGMYEFSCRSINGYSIHDAFERVKKEHPELELSGGGHALAMGLRFPYKEDSLNIFKEALEADFLKFGQIQEKIYYYFEPENTAEIVGTINDFNIFGNKFSDLKFIYTELFSAFDPEERIATIGNYNFKTYWKDEEVQKNLGKVITVVFSIKINSKKGPYFKIFND